MTRGEPSKSTSNEQAARQVRGAPAESEASGLMSPGEVAAMLHVDANTVARWSDSGRLRAVRTPGGHRRYYASEVLAIVRGAAR